MLLIMPDLIKWQHWLEVKEKNNESYVIHQYIMHSPRIERAQSSRLVCFATGRCSPHVTPRDTVGLSNCIPWHYTSVRTARYT
jgi:hypothetical protein